MNQDRNAEYGRLVIELGTLHREALARRLAEDRQIKLSKITEAASRRMVEFRKISTPVESRTLTRQAKAASPLTTGAASSPDSDLASESESSLDSA